MKQLKKIMTAIVLSSVVTTTAYAGDSIRTHNDDYGYAPQVNNQRLYVPAHDGRYGRDGFRDDFYARDGFYGAPNVIYGPPIRFQQREHEFIGNVYVGPRYRGHSDNEFSRKHHSRHRNNLYGYGGHR